MIVAERKPFDEIHAMLESSETILLVGCGGCWPVCLPGGEPARSILACGPRLTGPRAGRQARPAGRTPPPRCSDLEMPSESVGKLNRRREKPAAGILRRPKVPPDQ